MIELHGLMKAFSIVVSSCSKGAVDIDVYDIKQIFPFDGKAMVVAAQTPLAECTAIFTMCIA
mgnify:FL=1